MQAWGRGKKKMKLNIFQLIFVKDTFVCWFSIPVVVFCINTQISEALEALIPQSSPPFIQPNGNIGKTQALIFFVR